MFSFISKNSNNNHFKAKIRILVIGQLPPPYHGSNVMTKLFIESLKAAGCDTTIVQKTFSKSIDDVRKFSIIKVLKIPGISYQLICQLIRKKYDLCFYFLSIKPPSIFVDMLFLSIISSFRLKYVPYLHAKGLVQLDNILVHPLRT